MRHKHGLSNNRSYRVGVDKNGNEMMSRSEQELAARRKKLGTAGGGYREPGSLNAMTGRIKPRAANTAVRPNKDTYR